MNRNMEMPYAYEYGHAHKKSGNYMAMEGTGSVKASPDMAAAAIGIVTEGSSLEKAQQENEARASQVLKTLQRLGIDESDIQTRDYTVESKYDYIEGKQVFSGYKVTHLFKVTIRDIAKTGTIIDGAVESGANEIGGIEFGLSDTPRYYRKALKLAIMDAVSKAEEVEYTLDVQVDMTPVSLTEITGGSAAPVSAMLLKAEAGTPVQPGTLEVAARVKAVFEYTE